MSDTDTAGRGGFAGDPADALTVTGAGAGGCCGSAAKSTAVAAGQGCCG